MKIGIDNYTYHRYFGEIYPGQPTPEENWGLVDFTDHMLSLAYLDLIECLSIETCFINEDEKTIIKQLKRLNKPIYFAWGHPNGFMELELEATRKQFEFYFNLSQEFGANIMRIAGSSIKYHSEPHQPQIDKTKAYLEKLLPLAESNDIKLAIENHGDFFLRELDEIIQYFSTPYLGLTLDTGNFLRFDEDPVEAINNFGEKVYIVHAKDLALVNGDGENDPKRLGCVPSGTGIIDFSSIFQTLNSIAYTGPILIEVARMHPEYEAFGEPKMIEEGLPFLHQVRNEMVK
jgi:sugar phosphate isomerase/epimerase